MNPLTRALYWIFGRRERAFSPSVPPSAVAQAIRVITSGESRWVAHFADDRIEIAQGSGGLLNSPSRVLVELGYDAPGRTEITLRSRDELPVAWWPFVIGCAVILVVAATMWLSRFCGRYVIPVRDFDTLQEPYPWIPIAAAIKSKTE